jgi:isoquinoline 1-oxidoreductase alpha subunit
MTHRPFFESMTELFINGKKFRTNISPEVPLVWFLREELGLTGTKWACGAGFCGSCSVLVDGTARRSCQMTLAEASSSRLVTIEGISDDHPVKRAWIEERVPECGYCQPGQIITAISLLNRNPHPGEKDVVSAMDSNLCRCGTYKRIKKAVLAAACSVE